MLPDHALPALPYLVVSHAFNGSQHMEVARRKWRGAFFRSACAGRRTGQLATTKYLRALTSFRSQKFQQQFFGSIQLQQCRNLETQRRADHRQYRGCGFSGGTSRTAIEQRTSSRVVYGWSISSWFSATRDGVRHYRSRSWRTFTDLGRARCQGQSNCAQFPRTVLRAATLGITQAVIVLAQHAVKSAALLMRVNQVCVC